MTPDDVVDCLAALPIFVSVPRAELGWMAARGDIRVFGDGVSIIEAGAPVDEMFILLAGRAAIITAPSEGKRKILDVPAGNVLGAIPYSRATLAPSAAVAEDDTHTLVLGRSQFPDMVRECPAVTTALVHNMIDRTRQYYGVRLNDDRLQSLGRLASGLAHELNNPASAATRSAQSLAAALETAEAASEAIAAARLSDVELEVIHAVRHACAEPARTRGALDAADREDDIADWLARHHIDVVHAESFAACNIDLVMLDSLADALPAPSLGPAIRWLASGIAARDLARQIGSATGRIHDLVAAVKGFTFMDREAVPDDVNIARGLADTVAVLENKARAKSVSVRLETADGLPRVYGFGSEINQVWENLIDNAIDAARMPGAVTITATARGDSVVVRVTDDGSGIPDEHRARIFDPFFTTKAVGQGTGLGLDLARRVVHVHHGDIDFTSQPGRTVFRVRLPVSGARPVR
jgi:signal transduction histidine kinase